MADDFVKQFDNDTARHGAYLYNTGKLSSELASLRTNSEIEKNYSFDGKSILDLGCGDGRYALYLAEKFSVKRIVGIDPAETTIKGNIEKAKISANRDKIIFQAGDIYNLGIQDHFDCAVMRWMMHHLPDPSLAIRSISALTDTLIIVDPNGWNPVLKFNERFSSYHIAHGEKSFVLKDVIKWLKLAGFKVMYKKYINLVPMFCPDWMAKLCKKCEGVVEELPIIRKICCGQYIVIAKH